MTETPEVEELRIAIQGIVDAQLAMGKRHADMSGADVDAAIDAAIAAAPNAQE